MILWEGGRASIIGSISKHAHSEEALQILITTYWWREMQKKKIWIRFKGYHPSLTTHPFHYRLRWRLGRFFSVKKDVHLSRLSDLWQGFDYDFWPKKLQQIFRKQNLQILSKAFGKARRGLQWKSLFWAFLLNSLWSPSTQKISFHWAPLLAFPNVWLNIFKFCFLNNCWNFLGTKSGS